MDKKIRTFNIYQKIKELKSEDFTGQNVAIVIPMFDESYNIIEEKNASFHWTQKRDASLLLHYIISKKNSGYVCILQNGDEANETERKFDQVIFLHKFTPSEQAYIIDGLRENQTNLRITELY